MELLVVVIIIALLIGIFKRSGSRTGGAWFTRACPYCRQKIGTNARVCPWCNRDVPPAWRWQKE
jgi:hypothetical protein